MDVKLVMFREDGSKRAFPLKPGATTVGRKNDCDIRIPLGAVSRRHAEIILAGTTVTLRDLGAANGTFLNNHKVQEEMLEAGDQVMIGSVVFTLQINGKPADKELIAVRSKVSAASRAGPPGARVATSKHIATADDEVDPISALEALASSADQTAITPEEHP